MTNCVKSREHGVLSWRIYTGSRAHQVKMLSAQQHVWSGQSSVEYIVVLVGFMSLIVALNAVRLGLSQTALVQRISQSIDHQLIYDAVNIILY